MPNFPGTADVLTTPLAPTIVQNAQGTGGAISYQIVAVNAAGQDSIPSSATSTPANNASTPNNTISWTLLPGQEQTRVLKGGNLLATVGAGVTSYTDSAGSSGITYTVATSNPAAFLPSANSPIDGQKATYVYTAFGITPYATPTDWILLQGSATKVVKVTRFEMRCFATAVAYLQYALVKRTADDTTGTRASQSASVAQYDRNDPPPTAVVFLYSVIPGGLGAGVNVRTGRVLVQSVTAAAGAPTDITPIMEYGGARPSKAVTLRGITDQFAINFAGAAVPAGAVYDVLLEWSEE